MLKIFMNYLSLPISGGPTASTRQALFHFFWFWKMLQVLKLVKGDNKKNNGAFFMSYAPNFTASIIQKFIFQQFLFKNSAECIGESE